MRKKIVAFFLVVLGVVILVYVAKNKEEPKRVEIKDVKLVKAQTIKPKDINISVKSFGTVKSGEDTSFIAAVSGEVVYKNEHLKNGTFISKGELLVTIDEREYKLNIANINASISQVEASIKELTSELKNTKIQLNIEKNRLILDEKEFNKYNSIKEAVSDTALNKYKSIVLNTQKSLQSTKSKLEALPHKINYQKAKKEELVAKKGILEIALSRCKIYMPFSGVVYDVSVEKYKHVNVGEKLFKAYNSYEMQVELELSLSQFSKLNDFKKLSTLPTKLFSTSLNKEFKANLLNVSQNIDKDTRTLTLLYKINEPVLKGMFLQALIVVNELHNVLVIPKKAYHQGVVYVEEKGALHVKDVEVLHKSLDEYVVSGLKGGDKLIISDLSDAVEGMEVRVVR